MKNSYNSLSIKKVLCVTFFSFLFLQFLTFKSYSDNIKQRELIEQKIITDAKTHAIKTIKLPPKQSSLKI